MLSYWIKIFDDEIVFFYEYSSLKNYTLSDMILSSSHMLMHFEAAGGNIHHNVFAENRVSFLSSGRGCFPE